MHYDKACHDLGWDVMFFAYVDLIACIFSRPKAVVQHHSEFMNYLSFFHFKNSEELLRIHKCGTAIMVLPYDKITLAALFYFMPLVEEHFLVHFGPASANYPLGMYTDTKTPKSSKRKKKPKTVRCIDFQNSVLEAIETLSKLDDKQEVDADLIGQNNEYDKRLKDLRQKCKSESAIERFKEHLKKLEEINHNLHVPFIENGENECPHAIYFYVIGKYSSGWVTRVNEKTIGGDTGGLLIPVERVNTDSESSCSSESSSQVAKKCKFQSGTGA